MDGFNDFLGAINDVLWHDTVLFAILGTGILFTFWTTFSQWRALTHGWAVIRGRYDDPNDPGAINHFQALSAALSATVGLGNIGGVALAIALGGPGAVFWMWVVGFFGMSIKLTEVTLSMLYRNTDDPDDPHGGPMWVIKKGMRRFGPNLGTLGTVIGGIFCVTLLISATTGGNMFQAWNVGQITETYFGIPSVACGIILAVVVGSVILGGIKRIGAVAGRLVPFMCALYLLAGSYVLIVNAQELPGLLVLIVKSAFAPTEAAGAFIGGTAAYAFLIGMKRALFSNEAGQGSAPIAHSAVKTREPVREGIVAGLEPFIDTLVVCTFTALVILSTGIWNRPAEVNYVQPPSVMQAGESAWTLETVEVPTLPRGAGEWNAGQNVFMIVTAHENRNAANNLHRIEGRVVDDGERFVIQWGTLRGPVEPTLHDPGIYFSYVGATLTAKAFDSVQEGLGMWLVTMAAWLFAISTMISWAYYGEQGIVYLFGKRGVMPYKLIYCSLIIVATLGFIQTDTELDNLTGVGTGVMLIANLPIMLLLGYQAMRAYHNYIDRLKKGEVGPGHPAPSIEDVISGRDVR
ncbi:MAG: sodium:alanine symporter family protein [Gammaproteobacteria bacterium]|nr:sodium:alanine symporter family protein [Gammaproteobacteria bacterium]